MPQCHPWPMSTHNVACIMRAFQCPGPSCRLSASIQWKYHSVIGDGLDNRSDPPTRSSLVSVRKYSTSAARGAGLPLVAQRSHPAGRPSLQRTVNPVFGTRGSPTTLSRPDVALVIRRFSPPGMQARRALWRIPRRWRIPYSSSLAHPDSPSPQYSAVSLSETFHRISRL